MSIDLTFDLLMRSSKGACVSFNTLRVGLRIVVENPRFVAGITRQKTVDHLPKYPPPQSTPLGYHLNGQTRQKLQTSWNVSRTSSHARPVTTAPKTPLPRATELHLNARETSPRILSNFHESTLFPLGSPNTSFYQCPKAPARLRRSNSTRNMSNIVGRVR